MLLVHHIAAHQFTVVIYDNCSVSALTDRADHTLRDALCVVRIAKLIEQLLLLVVAHHALVGDGAPEVLMTVDIHDARDGLDTHSGERLLHVALEGLRLRVIDAIARRCLDEQVAVQHLLDGVDVAVVQARAVLRVALEVAEGVAVETVQSRRRSEPHVSPRILQDAVHLAGGQSLPRVKCLKQEVAWCRIQRHPLQNRHCHHRQCQHQSDQ